MAAKRWQYKPLNYQLEVIAEAVLASVALPVCLWAAAINLYNMAGLFLVFAVAAAYLIWNSFVAKVYVKEVEFDAENKLISFYAFGKRTTVDLTSCKEFRVREYPSSGKIYLRLEGHNILKNRFWINSSSFEDGRALFDQIRDIEFELHPDTLKAKARKTNEAYVEKFGYGRRKKVAERRLVLKALLSGKADTIKRKGEK